MQELAFSIENIRTHLQDLLETGIDPLDPYVLHISQELDKLLNSYHSLFKRL